MKTNTSEVDPREQRDMKILIMLNGLTHYFNLVTSKINEQRGVEIIYVYPRNKSKAMGDGVHETTDGVNFQLIQLEERMNYDIDSLYYDGLDAVLKEIKPNIIMLAETHIKSVMFDKDLKKIVDDQNIKIVLKSIPFQLKKYNESIEDTLFQINSAPLPPFDSIPFFAGKLFKSIKLDVLYKQFVLKKRRLRNHVKFLNTRSAIFNFADAHVNYIEEAYDIFSSYGVPKEKIFITYNSPDTDYYFSIKEKIEKEPLPLPFSKFRIVHLSRLVEWKRVDMLIEAVANMKVEFPEMELLIVGTGPEKDNLTRQALELGVTDSVQFLGGIYDAELLGKYLMSSAIYILAGMGGLSINDAMIFGLPVICSECDGTEKYLVREGYNGLYFEKGNQESLEEKIRYLFNNQSICNEMGDHSVEIIKNEINIHTVVEGYMKAFNYVLKD